MVSKNTCILQNDIGFFLSSNYNEEYNNRDNYNSIYVAGKVVKPGVVKTTDNASVGDIINLAGGILNNKSIKLVQIGLPLCKIVSHNKLDEYIDYDAISNNSNNIFIVLSEEDCIVQYGLWYFNYLINNINKENFDNYEFIKPIIIDIKTIFEKITKGRAVLRDLYDIRSYSKIIKESLNPKMNILEHILDNFYEELKEHIEHNKCQTLQCSQLSKITITKTCIGCGACKRICPVNCIVGEKKEKHYIEYQNCTHCGSCLSICPVNAITAGDNTVIFLRDILTPNKVVITQIAPAVRVSIGEAFGFEPGVNIEKKMVAALRKIGVNYVFDTAWAADLTIMEEACELQLRLEKYFQGDKSIKIPMLTSCCPAWVKFIEQNYSDMLDIASSAKSPMQMLATVTKEIWAKEKKVNRNDIVSVAIMPCTAKKYEASRSEFSKGLNYDIDYVITTNELISIFKSLNIDLSTIEEEEIDQIMGEYSGAGIIFGRTGGVIEAATRTAIEKMTGKRVENIEFEYLRGFKGFRACDLEVNGLNLRIGVAHGLKEAAIMLDKIRNGEEVFHAIEIMACKGGCVGGGGQPKVKKKEEVLEKRAEGLNNIDRSLDIRRSHENQEVINLYEKYLDYPMSQKAYELLHTKYFTKEKINDI